MDVPIWIYGVALVISLILIGLVLFAVCDVASRAEADDTFDEHGNVIGLDQFTGERRAALRRVQRRRA
jgi:hypothetical protein